MIAEVTLKLHPLPEAIAAATCSFAGVEPAVRTAMEIIQLGIPIARCEFIDVHTVGMVNAHSRLGLPEQPMLLMEFHGSTDNIMNPGKIFAF